MAAKGQNVAATQIALVGEAGEGGGFKLAVLADTAGALEVVQANLKDMPVEFERITIPAGGGLAFELPSDQGATTETEIVGVVLYHNAVNAYWPDRFTGANKPPQCSALDGITGIGEPGGACATCPLNAWGSEAREDGAAGDERGKACKNLRRVYLLPEGETLPLLLALPPTSLKPFRRYAQRLTTRGKPFYSVVTRVSLTKVSNAAGIPYSQAAFVRAEDLEPAQALKVKQYAEQLRPYMCAVKVQAADYGNDTDNGHDAAGAGGGAAAATGAGAATDDSDPF